MDLPKNPEIGTIFTLDENDKQKTQNILLYDKDKFIGYALAIFYSKNEANVTYLTKVFATCPLPQKITIKAFEYPITSVRYTRGLGYVPYEFGEKKLILSTEATVVIKTPTEENMYELIELLLGEKNE